MTRIARILSKDYNFDRLRLLGLYIVLSNGLALFHFVAYKKLQSHWTEQRKDQKITNDLSLLALVSQARFAFYFYKLLILGFKHLFGHL